MSGVPPFRSGEADVVETSTGSETAHTPGAKHIPDFSHAKDQRHDGKHRELE